MHPVALALYIYATMYTVLFATSLICYAVRYSGKESGRGEYNIAPPITFTAILVTVGALIDAYL